MHVVLHGFASPANHETLTANPVPIFQTLESAFNLGAIPARFGPDVQVDLLQLLPSSLKLPRAGASDQGLAVDPTMTHAATRIL